MFDNTQSDSFIRSSDDYISDLIHVYVGIKYVDIISFFVLLKIDLHKNWPENLILIIFDMKNLCFILKGIDKA